MKKSFKAHHTITIKGGRVASRKHERPSMRIASTPVPATRPPFVAVLDIGGRLDTLLITGRERVMQTRRKGS
jgi:hypothetical protein